MLHLKIAHAARPKGPARFKGSRSGVFLIAQGPATRVIGIGQIKILADRCGGETIALSGVIEVGGSTAPVYLQSVGAWPGR